MSHPYITINVAQAMLDNVIKLHEPPQSIICDRDKIFTSQFWSELFGLMGTQIKCSTTYHPQTDGHNERLNQCVEMHLRCMVGVKPTQ